MNTSTLDGTESASTKTRVAIIGTGFSGIALAIYLKKAGITDFVMLEKAADVGGTWRENTYPGAECDVPSALYSFSFEHNAEWQYKWSKQAQILDYLRHVSDKHQLRGHIHFGQEVVTATWNETLCCWRVVTASGASIECQFLVSAVGQLHHPAIPSLPGEEKFSGIRFHSAQWRHDIDLTGKRVAVIGNAASAVQFIPQIAKLASRLTVFQRSANWVLPKMDRPYRPWEQWLSDKFPWVTKLYRLRLWLIGEIFLYGIMRGNPLLAWWGKRTARSYVADKIADPALRDKLTPDYPIGAKRVLFSDDYYDGLARPNVELISGAVAGLSEHGIRCADGREIPVDVLIYGTGFRTNPFLAPMKILGAGGKLLADSWRQGAHAYLGITTGGFPNLFMMYGPNTNLGHNSIVVMSEAQARYIVLCIQGLDARGAKALDVNADAESAYNKQLQNRLSAMVWSKIDASWYKDGGLITNNWAGSTYEYLGRCRHIDWTSFRLIHGAN